MRTEALEQSIHRQIEANTKTLTEQHDARLGEALIHEMFY